MNFYCRERPHIRQMLIPDTAKETSVSSVQKTRKHPKHGLPKGRKHDTFRVFPEFRCTCGGPMLCNLPFRIVTISALILNLAAGPTILSAQQAPADVPTITIRTNICLVVVHVVVTDKKRQRVTGLKADDFTLEENGKKQKVSVFVPPGAAKQTAPAPLPPGILSNHPENVGPAGIPTVLLLDAANSPFKDQAYGRLEMLKYAAEQNQ